jgi:hypothetical protein
MTRDYAQSLTSATPIRTHTHTHTSDCSNRLVTFLCESDASVLLSPTPPHAERRCWCIKLTKPHLKAELTHAKAQTNQLKLNHCMHAGGLRVPFPLSAHPHQPAHALDTGDSCDRYTHTDGWAVHTHDPLAASSGSWEGKGGGGASRSGSGPQNGPPNVEVLTGMLNDRDKIVQKLEVLKSNSRY